MDPNILKDLRDIHLPPPPPLWPFAFEIWIAAAFTITLLIASVILLARAKKKWQLNKTLFANITALRTHLNEHRDHAYIKAEISALLRRLASHKEKNPELKAKNLLELKPVLAKMFRVPEGMLSELLDAIETRRFHKNTPEDGELVLSLTSKLFKKIRCKI